MKKLIIVFALIVPIELYSQITGNNLYEYQLGNSPGDEPTDLSTHYNRLNINYRYKFIRASIRYEQFVHPEDSKEYYKLSQYSVSYRNKGLNIKLGHFNETLGNGILLRTYEIPASVYEDQAYRVRQGFYRDLKGVNITYHHKYFSIKAIRGRSLLNVLPPTLDEKFRRPDLTEALEVSGKIYSHRLGMILMRNMNMARNQSFASIFASGNITDNLNYNIEIARELGQGSIFNLNNEAALGFYTGINYSVGQMGISLEYKDYRNIFIGAGISDPPTLVREQNYKVLNRSTHVPELNNEKGVQAEAFIGLKNDSYLTLNYTHSVNDFGRKLSFQEIFAEYQFSTGMSNMIKVFTDYSKDPLRLEFHRLSSGIFYERSFSSSYGASIQVEYQYFKREDFLNSIIQNGVLTVGGHGPGQNSLSFVYEISTDPNQTDNSDSPDIERGKKHWLGIDASYKINKTNKLNFFAGSRRGGPACTSGICYEVLDFKGFEVRLTSKF